MMKEDFDYFESLYESLDETKRKKFLELLVKAGTARSGEDESRIHVVGEEIFDDRGITPQEFITRTMIKKAYKEAEEGKQ